MPHTPTDVHGENIRALGLAADAADLMLSMGTPVGEVISAGLAICDRFCSRPVRMEVTSTLLTFAQERSTTGVPLTLTRPVVARGVNNRSLEAVECVVDDVQTGTVALDEAEERIHEIIAHPHRNPWWAFPLAAAGISAGVVPLYSTQAFAVLLAVIAGIVTERVLALCLSRRIASFFAQAIAAGVLTLTAALLSYGARHLSFLPSVDPTLVIVGGAVMLLVGLMFVGAFQDAIDENYVTATARILKVVMLTSGIVVGVVSGLFIADSIGLGIIIHPDPPSLSSPLVVSVLGAALIAAAYCFYCQSSVTAIVASGVIGAATWLIFLLLWKHTPVALVPSAFIASVTAGLLGALLERLLRTPSSALTTAGIVTLVPGVMLMAGLMQLVAYTPRDPRFMEGVMTLTNALGTGLAIAAGASAGLIVGRPLKRRLAMASNRTRKRRVAKG